MIRNALLSEGINILCTNNENISRFVSCRTEEVLLLLNRYIQEIELFNPAYGLVGTNDINELVIKHILDSLAPLGIMLQLLHANTVLSAGENDLKNMEIKIADAGSGAGLPGIPLAVTLPDIHFTLIERMGRRAGFLLNTKAALNLSNITIDECELEKTVCRGFNLITFRAFKPLEPKLLKTLLKLLLPSGIIAAYKGRIKKTETEMSGMDCNWEVIPYKTPFLDEERHLLVIKKQ